MKKIEIKIIWKVCSRGPDKPDDIPGVGLFVCMIDTEGNKVALLQPKMPPSKN
jgi:predicted enzyme related to lactoylglutathione lyase